MHTQYSPYKGDLNINCIIGYININSYRYKYESLKDLVLPSNLDIFCVAETKLNASFPDAQFAFPNFRMFRKDKTEHAGGLLAYIRSDIPCRGLSDIQGSDSFELLPIEITLSKHKWILIFSYKSPSLSKREFTNEISPVIDRLFVLYSNVMLIGDLNFDMSSNTDDTPLHDICLTYSMVNTINEPTFYHAGGSSSIDVILTNQKGRLITSGTINTHLSDGHMLIYTVMRLSAPKQPPRTIVYRSFKTFREKDFIDDLSAAPLHVADTFNDPDDCYWMFNCMLTDILNSHAPLKQKTVRSKHTPFMNSRLKKAVMNKHRLWRRYKKYPSRKTWEQYRLQRNLVTIASEKPLLEPISRSVLKGGLKTLTSGPP